MRTFTIHVTKASGVTAAPNFKIWADGELKVNLTLAEVDALSGGITTFSCYRDGHFFSFPNSTHSLVDSFLSATPLYKIMDYYPSKKWTSYTPHSDAGYYNVTVTSVT